MARFYGSAQGARGEASRLGGASSGLRTIAAGWSGAVRCDVYDKGGRDFVRVELGPWHGRGTSRLLYDGPVNGEPEAKPEPAPEKPARVEYQPKTGQPCHCKPGQHRDNCPACEGTGMQIDFAAIRARK